MLLIFTEDDAEREESAWRFWEPFFNAALESVDKTDRDQRLSATCENANSWQATYRKGDSELKFSGARRTLFLCAEMISAKWI